MTPEITYIVSAFQRDNGPQMLACVLNSLAVQSHKNFEVIVADNSIDKKAIRANQKVVAGLKDDRFKHVLTGRKTKVNDCYWAAEWVAKNKAKGNWLCFPCDDCYYAPDFGKKMLAAGYSKDWKFVCCKMVLSQLNQAYAVIDEPGLHFCIKTNFIIRKESFPGFPGKPNSSAPSCSDRALGGVLSKEEIEWGVVPEVMVVHN
jgi:glycosyltransferase involved in cell wall biosynthesis